MTFPSVTRRGSPTPPWRWTLLALLTACATGELTDPPATGEVLTHPNVGSEMLVLPDTIVTGINQPLLLTLFGPARADSPRTTVVWSATGGEITSSGLFTSAAAGSYKIRRWRPRRNRSDTTVVVVTPSHLERVHLTPDSIQIASQQEATFTARGHFSDSTSGMVAATWSATGGTVDAAGVYRAGNVPGRYRVVGKSSEGPADTAVVIIGSGPTPPPEETPPEPPASPEEPPASPEEPPASPEPTPPTTPPAPTLASVTLTPSSISVQTGSTYQFQAKGTMSDGTPSGAAPAFTATGGSISSSGSYRAGLTAGSYRVVASIGGLADTAAVTITAPPPPPPPPPPDTTPTPPPLPSKCKREVNVASSSALSSAMSGANPGDCITLASGTYAAVPANSRSGTAADSIYLRGPKSAVLTGILGIRGRYWNVSGFTIRGGTYCIEVNGGRSNTFRDLDVSGCGQEGIVLHFKASQNVVEGNWIHDTGKSSRRYGEAVYIGRGGGTDANVDPSDSNRVKGNQLGPNVTAEHIDVKRGTRGNVIEGNTSDARGIVYESGHVGWVYMSGGINTVLRGNSLTNLNTSGVVPFAMYGASGNLWTRNVVRNSTFTKGWTTGLLGSGNVVKCDNDVDGRLWGVTCQQ